MPELPGLRCRWDEMYLWVLFGCNTFGKDLWVLLGIVLPARLPFVCADVGRGTKKSHRMGGSARGKERSVDFAFPGAQHLGQDLEVHTWLDVPLSVLLVLADHQDSFPGYALKAFDETLAIN